MRTSSILLCSLLLGFGACGSSDDTVDADPFDTFEECFMEHSQTEGLSVQHAITVCCLDHPIGSGATMGGIVCGASESTCDTYVTASLMTSDATATDITAACTDYENQK